MKIPKKVSDRFCKTIKSYQVIAASRKSKDVSEADTVTVVKDMLADIFGYDKYEELTSEQQIRGTFCDLAVKIDGKIRILIEVKAAGIDLNVSHLRQAVNYGANEGIEWVALTNAVDWKLYRIIFGQPIEFEEVSSFSILEINLKSEEDQGKLFLFCKEGLSCDAMEAYHQQTQILNKYTIGQMVISEPVVSVIRKELRKLFPDMKIDHDQIVNLLSKDVIKREVFEGDKLKEAQVRIKKAANKVAKQKEKKLAKDNASDEAQCD